MGQGVNATNRLVSIKRSVHLIPDIPRNLPPVVADADRVIQVVINPVSNAVTFAEAGQLTIRVEENWSSMVIRVADQGTGISEADQAICLRRGPGARERQPRCPRTPRRDNPRRLFDNIAALETALSAQRPDLALVVGTAFQEPQNRVQIQGMVGSQPCLVLYINTEPFC